MDTFQEQKNYFSFTRRYFQGNSEARRTEIIQKCGSQDINKNLSSLLSYFEKNSLYVSGVSVCIFVALHVGMFVARANKVEGTMS